MTAFHQMGLQPEELLAAVEGWANQRLQKLSPQARPARGPRRRTLPLRLPTTRPGPGPAHLASLLFLHPTQCLPIASPRLHPRRR